ncbi:MAG: alanine--tRNA ligase [Myxococcales bacterium]|nr:alanine--tRNA ligase [Myxococcales bacterium]
MVGSLHSRLFAGTPVGAVNAMPPLDSRPHTVAAIRARFLDYFAKHGHARVASHSLLPPADPTLLFVNAGMVQFKDFFTGARPAPFATACSTQKCLRVSGKHNDLENVGRTKRHHTLFEMLGNFSFGDYFKRGAIQHAWTFLVGDLGIDPQRLCATYFGGNERMPADLEARDLWHELAGLPFERIVPLGEKDNFWAMGDSGPCGPCTEIYFDLDPGQGSACTVAADDGRYMEVWNLVFMQYDRQDGVLTPLPAPCVDTGMGLERIAAVVQGANSNYGTDLFARLIARTEQLAGQAYGGRFDAENVISGDAAVERDVAFRVIADHARATAFLIAEGIYPDSLGRGYVLRRVLRRAIRWGRKLGLERPFLFDIAGLVTELAGDAFPELVAQRALIERVTKMEELRFQQTLAAGETLIEAAMAHIDAAGTARVLAGDLVFTLHDSHGFPTDLTALIAAEHGFSIDIEEFDVAMAAQRARGRASWKAGADDVDRLMTELADSGLATQFVGHAHDTTAARVIALVADGERTAELAAAIGSDGEPCPAADGWAVLDVTPCYGEGGGQIGDPGVLAWAGGVARVVDTRKHVSGLHLHRLQIDAGLLRVGEAVTVTVDAAHRASVRAHHSATHLLHKALRDVLGGHVKQRGSLVAPGRLRFDFAHFAPVTPAEVAAIERHVNERALANAAAIVRETSMDDAVASGALAFFGDKYGDVVRMMQLGDSIELCGGTHVHHTGDIGLCKIVGEEAVSSGVRRIEAVCHLAALRWVADQTAVLDTLARRLNAPASLLGERVERLLTELKSAGQEIEKWKHAALRAQSGGGAGNAVQDREIGGLKVRFQLVAGGDAAALRSLADDARSQHGAAVVGLFSGLDGGRALLLVAASPAAVARAPAGALVAELAPRFGGKGGGRPDLAQAGVAAQEDTGAVAEAFFGAVAARLAP